MARKPQSKKTIGVTQKIKNESGRYVNYKKKGARPSHRSYSSAMRRNSRIKKSQRGMAFGRKVDTLINDYVRKKITKGSSEMIREARAVIDAIENRLNLTPVDCQVTVHWEKWNIRADIDVVCKNRNNKAHIIEVKTTQTPFKGGINKYFGMKQNEKKENVYEDDVKHMVCFGIETMTTSYNEHQLQLFSQIIGYKKLMNLDYYPEGHVVLIQRGSAKASVFSSETWRQKHGVKLL